MCITWIAPDVEVDKIANHDMVHNKCFMDAIAVLSLSIGDEEIYRRQDQSDTPVSLDSALLQAIEKGAIDAAELLLAVGANPYLSLPSGDTAISAIVRMRDEDGRTVLHSACRHADVTSLLLCEGCDPNVVDNNGYTPIMVASKYSCCDTVATLIGAGADGTTPLVAAAEAGQDNIVATLIGAGADVNKSDGTTFLIEAAEAGHDNIVATLIGAGADVNKADGTTPLIAAAEAGHDNIVATLIGAGADVNKGGQNTPLIAAARVGYDNIVATLIGAGADVNKADGTTPLIAAAKAGHDNIVATLIGAGADVNKADGTTPLIAAAKAGHDNIVATLNGAGAKSIIDTGNNHLLQQLLQHPNIKCKLVAAMHHGFQNQSSESTQSMTEEDKEKLEVENLEIKHAFAGVIYDIFKSWEDRKMLDDVTDAVQDYLEQVKGEKFPIEHDDRALRSIVHEHSSWFNYDLLLFLVQKCGGKEERDALEHYIQETLKCYNERPLVEMPPKSFDHESSSETHKRELIYKLPPTVSDTITGHELNKIINSLKESLGLLSLIMKQHESGGTELHFGIPDKVDVETQASFSSLTQWDKQRNVYYVSEEL